MGEENSKPGPDSASADNKEPIREKKNMQPAEGSRSQSESDSTLDKKESMGGATQTGGAAANAQEGGPRTATGVGVGARSIGPYALLRILGEGGMGQVWLAEQTAPVRRRVALKLIKGGMYDNRVIQRFEAERQSLAVMNHPTIAKIFDAGSTPDGQPYFVMEYVDGPSITRYCDNKRLKIRERLRLFLQVCDGVQHAHQKAIIHRDLKPSNVLVEEVDGKPVPRIIDFGIAKAIESDEGGERAQVTRLGALIGTPGFISPEQADPGVRDVDTRTDVYSLGVILYVLMTGTLPFDEQEWTNRPIDEVLRQLRQEDPPTPSAKLRSEGKTSTERAERRSSNPHELVSLLRGDLDWITMKALEKDRVRRYGTPTELAADIERYLTNQPVTARKASAGYRLKKYVQRNKLGVAAGTAAGLVLIAFVAMQTVELRRIRRERDRANRIADFMAQMFRVADPSESRGNTVTAREILDKAAANIDKELAQEPEVRTQLMDLMGTVYQNLGLYSRAQTLLERALEIQKRELGPEKGATLKTQADLAWTLDHEGKYPGAEKLERTTLEAQRRTLGPENSQTLRTMNYLGWTLHQEGKENEAEKTDREAIGLEARQFGEQDPLTVSGMANLGVTLMEEGKYSDAERLQRRVLELEKTGLGTDQPDTLQTMDNLASTYSMEQRYADAEQTRREALEVERRVLGPEHPYTAETMDNLAYTLQREGKFAEAEKLQRKALEIEKKSLGPEHPDTLLTMLNIAVSLNLQDRKAEGEQLARETLAIAQRALGPAAPLTLRTMGYFPVLYTQERRFADATKAQRQILEVEQHAFGNEDARTLATMTEVASALAREQKLGEAEKCLKDLRAIQAKKYGPDDARTAATTYNMACFAARAGEQEKALALLSEAMEHGLGPDIAGQIGEDTDLVSLHGDARFVKLVEAGKEVKK
ncbi:MAG TPA: serine/threonine-protein kinase [Candidatus Eisenbacteria bacterium]|nr:serine/threonine-protein kinase [Candidatus Eisenbacteria bacterium]